MQNLFITFSRPLQLMDIVDSKTRSKMMSGIKSINTKPEMQIRSELHRRGMRFRIHVKNLPGSPDLVLHKHKVTIFVHGCFWHGHRCHLFKIPSTRRNFWMDKIKTNQKRDERNIGALQQAGWRTYIIWECAIRNKTKFVPSIYDHLEEWIKCGSNFYETLAYSQYDKLQSSTE